MVAAAQKIDRESTTFCLQISCKAVRVAVGVIPKESCGTVWIRFVGKPRAIVQQIPNVKTRRSDLHSGPAMPTESSPEAEIIPATMCP